MWRFKNRKSTSFGNLAFHLRLLAISIALLLFTILFLWIASASYLITWLCFFGHIMAKDAYLIVYYGRRRILRFGNRIRCRWSFPNYKIRTIMPVRAFYCNIVYRVTAWTRIDTYAISWLILCCVISLFSMYIYSCPVFLENNL